jgi:hypothetical protein
MIGQRQSNSKYLKIADGHICDTKNTNLGNYIGGYIKKLEFKTVTTDTTTIELLEITISWEQEVYQLNLPLDTTGRGLMLCLPNIDYTKALEINCAKNEAGYSYIWVSQNGKNVTNYWTKENPKNKPEWSLRPDGKYDKTKEIQYLKTITQSIAQEIDKFVNNQI